MLQDFWNTLYLVDLSMHFGCRHASVAQLSEQTLTACPRPQVTPRLNFSALISSDSEKGFFCRRSAPEAGGPRCLGGGKGRHYQPMTDQESRLLRRYYLPFNRRLSRLLRRLGRPEPGWLLRELADGT